MVCFPVGVFVLVHAAGGGDGGAVDGRTDGGRAHRQEDRY